MKRIITLALAALTLLPTAASAQDSEDIKALKGYVQADLVSHYMWRGIDMAGISIQPQAGVSWRGLSLTASGNAGFDKEDLQEIDLTLGYEHWGFNIGVTDYWTTGTDPENRYFYYVDKKTPHQLEANIGYTCKYASIQAYTMFWGNDYKINGDRAFSTFIELSVPFRAGGLDWDVRAGVTPMESAGYSTILTTENTIEGMGIVQNHYIYGGGFTCNMAALRATKTLSYKNVEIPVYAELHANPELKTAHFLVGVCLKAF